MGNPASLSLRQTILRNAQDRPGLAAYVYDGERLNFAQYYERASRIAASLHALGARAQDRIGILGMNSLNFSLLCGACEFHGFIAATVNYRLAAEEMVYIIADAAPVILVFEAQYAALVDQIRSRLPSVRKFVVMNGETPEWAIALQELIDGGSAEGPPMAPPHDRDVALLIYTSGTTGRPKGAMLSQAAVAASADMVASDTSVSPADRLLLVMPQFHIGAQNWENAQRLAGGTVFLHRSFDAEACLRAIQDDKITIAVFAPTMLQALLERPDLPSYDLSSLRAVVYSAAAMHLATLRQAITAFGPVLVQQYGQTEGIGTVLPASDHLPGGNEVEIRRLASVGRPFPGCGVKIVDEDDIEQPVGTSGELCLQGPSIMSGYWNNSAASVATLSGGWLHTGDMAKLDADGYIYLVDRKKDVIISGGENIYSLEVENAVIAHPAVARVAVVGMPDAKWGEAVCAFVVLVPDAALTEADIIAHTRRLIANYKAPRKVVLVDALPELASGKVAKNDLRTLARTIAENVAAR